MERLNPSLKVDKKVRKACNKAQLHTDHVLNLCLVMYLGSWNYPVIHDNTVAISAIVYSSCQS